VVRSAVCGVAENFPLAVSEAGNKGPRERGTQGVGSSQQGVEKQGPGIEKTAASFQPHVLGSAARVGGDGVGVVAGAGAGDEAGLVDFDLDMVVLVGLVGGGWIEGDLIPGLRVD